MARGIIESSSLTRGFRVGSGAVSIALALGLLAGCTDQVDVARPIAPTTADRIVGGEPIVEANRDVVRMEPAITAPERARIGPRSGLTPTTLDPTEWRSNPEEPADSTEPGNPQDPKPKLTVGIDPEAFSLAAFESRPLQARLTDAQGRQIQTRDAIWWSGDSRIATVGADGIVTARSPGHVTISVSVGGVQGNASLTVTRIPVARVDIRSPTGGEVVVGHTVQLSTVARDASGQPLLDRGAPTWSTDRPQIASVDAAGRLTVHGPGAVRVTAVVDGVGTTLPIQAVLRFVQLAAGAEHTCAVSTTGTAWCWGTGNHGELGAGFSSVSQDPTAVMGGYLFQSLSSRTSHTCGLTSGSGSAVCWGRGTGGRLGTGLGSDAWEPAKVAGVLSFEVISAGATSTCALTNGLGYCWGSETGTLSPVPVSALVGFEDVQVAADQAAGVSSGELFHFPGGAGAHVMSGSSPDPVPARVLIPAMGDKDVLLSYAVGQAHACATVSIAGGAGTWCWGDGGLGQLGDGNFTSSPSAAVAVAGTTSLAGLVAGANHTCGLAGNGDAWCWGDNSHGQLGSGSDHMSSGVPVKVAGVRFSSLAAGTEHTCGISTVGEAWCWGRNDSFQLGSTVAASSNHPVLVSSQHAP